jgi:hypothetical protein
MKNVTVDHSRADAGEAVKDIATKGKDSKAFEKKENFTVPEFATKVAVKVPAKVPAWLVTYIKLLKGETASKAKGRMDTDKMYTLLKPESKVLIDALRESTDNYHGEVAKTVGAYGVPIAGALGLGSIVGGDENKG